MDSWLLSILTLIGVVVEALASFISTRALERSRWRREEDLRWADMRLDCYSNFASAIMTYITLAYRITAGLGLNQSVQPLDDAVGLPALADAESALSVAWERVMLLGSPSVIRAAQAWRDEAWRLDRYARRILQERDGEFGKATQARRAAQRDFYVAVRADLGVTGGEIPVFQRRSFGNEMRLASDCDQRAPEPGQEPEPEAAPAG